MKTRPLFFLVYPFFNVSSTKLERLKSSKGSWGYVSAVLSLAPRSGSASADRLLTASRLHSSASRIACWLPRSP